MSNTRNVKVVSILRRDKMSFIPHSFLLKLTERQRQILSLAIPSIISNITIPLLGLVDLSIIGHIGNETYISAIAVGTMIFNVIYWLLGFLRMGTSGLTSQAVGRQEQEECAYVLVRALSVSLFLGGLFLILSPLLYPLLLNILNTPNSAREYVGEYFHIVMWGAPAMLSLYSLTGWFIGMQDTKTPMYIAIIQNITNVLCSLIFVFVCHWQIIGVAAGTLIAQWIGFVLSIYMADKMLRRSFIHSSLTRLLNQVTHRFTEVYNKGKLRFFFTVNRDIFLRTLCLVLVNAAFTSFSGKQGATILSANTLLLTFFTFFSYVMDGFAYAGEALCGKSFGANDKIAFTDYVRQLLRFGVAMVAIFTLVYAFLGSYVLQLMSNDASVLQTSSHVMTWAELIPICAFMAFVFDGVFIGIVATRYMLLSTFVAAIVFFLTYALCENFLGWGNHAIWLSFLLYLLSRSVILGVIYRSRLCTRIQS